MSDMLTSALILNLAVIVPQIGVPECGAVSCNPLQKPANETCSQMHLQLQEVAAIFKADVLRLRTLIPHERREYVSSGCASAGGGRNFKLIQHV